MSRAVQSSAACIGAASLGLVALFACRPVSHDSPEAAAQDVVARFGDHAITVEAFDRRVLSLPPADRPQPGEDLDAWYREQIRQLAVESVLAAEAAESDLASEKSFVTAKQEMRKRLALQLCLVAMAPEVEAISEEELRTAYEARREELARPERRLVYHLFKRFDAGEDHEAVRREAERLRERVLRGESFSMLAGEHSDSEWRHRDGALGWMTREDLAGGFAEVVFALEEGVPSEPLPTRDGYHLFFVDHISPARQITYDEAADRLRQEIAAKRTAELMQRLDAEIEPPERSLILDRQAFVEIVQAGDPQATVLRLDDYALTLGDITRATRQAAEQQPQGAPPPRPWRLLENARRRELIHRRCLDEGLVPEARVEEQLETWRKAALLGAWRQRRMAETAAADEDRLRRFYESNIDRFTSPPRWHLKRLSLPLGEDPATLMAQLEKAVLEPGLDLEALRERVGGEIEDLGTLGLGELRRLQPALPQLVAPLAVGELTPPHRTLETLEVVEVVAKESAEPLPFEEVEERAAAAYAELYAREVYEELSEQVLAGAPLEIEPEGLARLREAGLPKSDVSAEDLEELLEKL